MRASVIPALLLVASPCAAIEEEVRTVASRSGVTESFLLITPDAAPVASVVLFAGGEGVVGVGNFQRPTSGSANFPVRNRRRFAEHRLLVAVLDAPSDHASGLGSFRSSRFHSIYAPFRRSRMVRARQRCLGI
jgi:hypothetical protein